MLERLERLSPDPILGLMAAFRADTDPHKVDLGVGVYRDDHGDTPVLKAVRHAEQSVLGGLLIDNGAFDRIGDVVADSDFYRDDHRRSFQHLFAVGPG